VSLFVLSAVIWLWALDAVTGDEMLHVFGGAGILWLAQLALGPPLPALELLCLVVLVAGFGIGREIWQHGEIPHTAHVWREALAWPIGAAVAALLH
jgi:hypothetical protein